MASLNDFRFLILDFGLNGVKSASRHVLCAGLLCAWVVIIGGSGCATVKKIESAPKAWLPAACKMTLATARCEDGEVLVLRRYQNRNGGTKPGAVVLCHGIGENGNIFDLGNGNSLARHLAGEGLDVWVADLRGCGLSGIGAPYSGGKGGRPAADWQIEDYVAQDVPAILSAVRQASGAKKVVWVGHNLGACIALAFAAAHPQEKDFSIVSVGASLEGQEPYPPVLADEAGSCRRFVEAPGRFPSLAAQPSADVPQGWEALFYNPAHMSAEMLEVMVRTANESVPPRVAREFVAMLRGGALRSSDGRTNYADEAKKITCPAYFICGKADNLADTGAVRRLYQGVSSAEKDFRLFCLTNGARVLHGTIIRSGISNIIFTRASIG